MDSGYYTSPTAEADEPRKPKISTKEIGKTVIDGSQAGRFTQSIGAALRDGVSRIELQPIPGGMVGGGEVEEYGKEEREEIKQLVKINEAEITSVHVPHQVVSNLSGQTREGFSESERYRAMEEIKKHVDFAADVAGGGSIVIHTGEFPRSIAHGKHTKGKFWGYPGEEKEAQHHLIDPRSGKLVTIKEDQELWVPIQREDPDDPRAPDGKKWLKDENDKYVVDEFWKERYEDKFDEDGKIKDLTDPEVRRFLVPVWDFDKQGNIATRKLTFEKYKEEEMAQRPELTERQLVRSFFKKMHDAEISSSLGSAREFEQHYYKGIDQLEKIKDAIKFWRNIEAQSSEEKKEELTHRFREQFGPMLPPGELKLPTEHLQKQLNGVLRQIAYGRETAVSGRQRARQVQDLVENAQFLDEYGLNKSVNSLAELGVYAMRETKAKKCNPIYLTPENIFPEMGYGSHPRELIELVKTARKTMINRLTAEQIADPAGRINDDGTPIYIDNLDRDPNMTKEEAAKFAKTHIKATLDTAHMGMWYKYFKPEQGETEEHRIARFREWYMGEVKALGEDEVIGNIHVVDGFGRSHSHLGVGKGILPVVEAVEYLKDKGVTSLSSEGHGDLRELMTGTWEAFGSPIYSAARSGGGGAVFSDVQNSYFGRTTPPPYIVGQYRPSEEWGFWSDLPME